LTAGESGAPRSIQDARLGDCNRSGHTAAFALACRAAAARPSFQYAAKAHRMLTHRKRLTDDDTFRRWWDDFWVS
jgi:hypothetical protein